MYFEGLGSPHNNLFHAPSPKLSSDKLHTPRKIVSHWLETGEIKAHKHHTSLSKSLTGKFRVDFPGSIEKDNSANECRQQNKLLE